MIQLAGWLIYLNRLADMEIQCKSSAMQYPLYCKLPPAPSAQCGGSNTHTHGSHNEAPAQWSEAQVVVSVQTAPVCHTPLLAGLYAPHYCTTMGWRQYIAGAGLYGGAVKLDDTSHRAHGTKVLTCTSISAIGARNTDALKNQILIDSNQNHIF